MITIDVSETMTNRTRRFWRRTDASGNFSLHRRVQNGSGSHPAFYPTGIRGSFPGKG